MLRFRLPNTVSTLRRPRAVLAYLLIVVTVVAATSVCESAFAKTQAVSHNRQQTAPNFHTGKMAEMAELSPPASPTPTQSTISKHDAVKMPGRKKTSPVWQRFDFDAQQQQEYSKKDHRRHCSTLAVRLLESSHTGTYIREVVDGVLTEWDIEPSNSSNMVVAFRKKVELVKKEKMEKKKKRRRTFLRRIARQQLTTLISCFAHSLQLVVNNSQALLPSNLPRNVLTLYRGKSMLQ